MRILVLGNSDSAGSRLPNRDEAWPALLARELPAIAGEQVEVSHTTLEATAPNAIGYLDSRLDQHDPDVVVLMLASYEFSLRLVAGRVRQLFGERAGGWFLRRQRGIDARAMRAGRMGGRTLYCVRRVVRAIIGTAPMMPYGRVVDAYTGVILRLAQGESRQLVVVGGTRFGGVSSIA